MSLVIKSQRSGKVSIAGKIFRIVDYVIQLTDPANDVKLIENSNQFKSGNIGHQKLEDKVKQRTPGVPFKMPKIPKGIFSLEELEMLDKLSKDSRKLLHDHAMELYEEEFEEKGDDDDDNDEDTSGDEVKVTELPTEAKLLEISNLPKAKALKKFKEMFEQYGVTFDPSSTPTECVAILLDHFKSIKQS